MLPGSSQCLHQYLVMHDIQMNADMFLTVFASIFSDDIKVNPSIILIVFASIFSDGITRNGAMNGI